MYGDFGMPLWLTVDLQILWATCQQRSFE